MIVLSNNKIFTSVLRAAQLILLLAAVFGLSLRALRASPFKDAAQVFDITLFAVGVGFFILEHFLERALRKCPVCQTRITSNTEEKRRCLECNTELWDYWDE